MMQFLAIVLNRLYPNIFVSLTDIDKGSLLENQLKKTYNESETKAYTVAHFKAKKLPTLRLQTALFKAF